MKKIALAALAATLSFAPAQAGSFDWWLINGAPGASSIDFVDVASINENGQSVSFKVATYWRNGNSEQRNLTMKCGSSPVDTGAVDLWKFVCGSKEHRLESGLIVDANSIDWLAKTVFEMPS